MKQIVQDPRGGTLDLREVAPPLAGPQQVLIATQRSVISAGTERMARNLAQKSLLGKARERPDEVRRVLQKVRTEGLRETMRQVREKLDDPMSLGYSSVGMVLACGRAIQHLKPGDYAACNGPHAELVVVPGHLAARVPDGVTLDSAAFTVLGAIALQGVRLSRVTLGERVLVIGLGLIGQLTVSLLQAAGCVVFGSDPDPARCELAKQHGAALAIPNLTSGHIADMTAGHGADAVIITASTPSQAPIRLAAEAIRQRGRIVLVGVVGLELDRRPFYFKEAEFVVSCSYGPGRYDPDYEERGHDYPFGHVRWTEHRNMQAVLQLMAAGKLDVSALITHRFSLDDYQRAYELIEEAKEPHLGVLLEYAPPSAESQPRPLPARQPRTPQGPLRIGVLGAGNFAKMVLLPCLAASPRAQLVTICSAKGLHAAHLGQKFHFQRTAENEHEVLSGDDIDVVFSITQHQLHASHILQALQHGKHCFVEKPLCITIEQLQEIEAAVRNAGAEAPNIMVGFNRRFAPATLQVQQFFQDVVGPRTVSIRMNAGAIPSSHWTQHDDEGGGRIIGEACHAVDLATAIIGAPPVRVFAEAVGGQYAPSIVDDQCFITLRHADGSVANIAYLASGDAACPKERIEVFGGGRTAVIDDFTSVTTYAGGKRRMTKIRKDKGHAAEIEAFLDATQRGLPSPIPWHELRAVTLATLLAVQSLREGMPLDIPT